MTKGELKLMINKSFFIAILTSIIATIIINTVIFLINKIKNRKKRTLNKRIKEANIKAFFYNRKILREDSGNVGRDIERAENHVYLIGSWLSTSLNDNFEEAIIEKVEAGVEFFFCFNDLNLNVIEIYERYLNVKKEDVIKSLHNTYQKLFEIRSKSAEIANKIHIFCHNQMIPTTFWGIDIEDKQNSYYKLDHKVIKGDISSSYGLDYGYSKDFSENIKTGYIYVLRDSTEIFNLSDVERISADANKNKDISIITDNFK